MVGGAGRQVESLTALRGVAALAVVHTHVLRLYESVEGAPGPPPLAWLDLGQFAVTVFFCLSGFTLVLAHGQDRWDRRGWGRFLVRRVFRVYPAFLVSFTVCGALGAGLASVLPAGTWVAATNRVPTAGEAVAMLSFTSNWFGIVDRVNTVFWSMPIEFQFYLMFPLLLMALRRSVWAVAAIGAALAGLDRVAGWPDQTLSLVWVFAAGMVLGWFYEPGRGRLIAALGGIVAVLAAAVLSDVPVARLRGLPGPIGLYFGVLAASVVWAAARLDGARGRLWAGLRDLGEVSYSLYLFHTPVVLVAFLIVRAGGLGGVGALAAIEAVVVPGSVAVAAVAWRWVERPGVAQGRRLSRGALFSLQ